MATILPTPRQVSAAAVCFIAIGALAVAMGIGRFAFTPMLPLMVRDGVISRDAGAWLAASNYLGYLVGALVSGRIRLSSPSLMMTSLVGTVAATAAMGASEGLVAWLVLRFAAGLLSAWTLVATSAWALRELARAERTRFAGFVYSGVGLGIAVVGAYCLSAASPGVTARQLWLGLGELAAVLAIAPILWLGWHSRAEPAAAFPQKSASPDKGAYANRSSRIIICYGLFGFGYILPATFLPAMARVVIDDPAVFGLAWPLFGVAAALSTVIVGPLFGRFNQLRVWACNHVVMGVGVMLPTIWICKETIAAAALFVGGSFVVITMLGLQEARARAPGSATILLGRMTTAFAIGQLAGPLASWASYQLPLREADALSLALWFAAVGLWGSAIALWWESRSQLALPFTRSASDY